MLKKRFFVALIGLLVASASAAAQDETPEPTPEATAGVSAEITPEATAEAQSSFEGPGSYTVRQPVGDLERVYQVYIPERYNGDPTPLVIVMHGAGGDGASTESLTGFDALADRENFVVVYPDGINNAWNDNRPGNPRISVVDDVRFLDNIIVFMERSLNIDPLRVYATGYSMGGMMSYRAGCELPRRFAAVASVASTMPLYLLENCDSTLPIPVLVVQGTDDPVIPWTGIPNAYLSAAQTIGFWRDHNACAEDFAIEVLPDSAPDDYTVVMRQQMNGCAADVMLYGVYFGGHTWPGHPISVNFNLGLTTQDIDATELIWAFFSSHVNTNQPED
ncbi:MAG: alpha/beta fold hydrolase [Anaerolineae bacterium]|nr:alpha/beta fold hydrolase [Anaerolineae bacterium]